MSMSQQVTGPGQPHQRSHGRKGLAAFEKEVRLAVEYFVLYNGRYVTTPQSLSLSFYQNIVLQNINFGTTTAIEPPTRPVRY